MNTTRAFITLLAAGLGAGMNLDLQAQEDQFFSPFVRSLTRPLQKGSGNAEGQAKDGKGMRDQQVARNIDRFRREAARLNAQGKTAAEIHAALYPRQELSSTGSITGTLYQSDGVTPLSSSVFVWAYDEFGLYCGYSFTSYGSGVYQIQNLATGNYYVLLGSSVDNYVSEYYKGVVDWRDATLVPVVDGQTTTGIDFVLRQYRGAIAGTVSDEVGTPVANAGVQVCDLDQNWISSGSTNSSGHYTVGALPTGDFKLQAGVWGSGNYIPQWFDKEASFDAAAIVHVIEPETTKGKDFTLERGGAISGKVVLQGDDTSHSWTVSMTLFDAEGNYVVDAQNDSAGGFSISGLASGTYTLFYHYDGVENFIGGWYEGASDRTLATPIQVTAPETTMISLLLQRGGAIAGTISYPSPRGIIVIAYDERKHEVQQAMTDENGHFVISPLPGGRYKLLASTVQSSYAGPHALDQWYNKEADFSKAEFVDVNPPDTTKSIDFVLSAGGTISVSLYGPDGLPLIGAGTVYVCDVRGARLRPWRYVAGGWYAIGGLPTGQYKLLFVSSSKGIYASEWYNGKASSHAATVVSVTAHGAVIHIDMTLEYSGSLGGYLKDNAGIRLTADDHEISIMLYEADSASYVAGGATTFVGGYQGKFLPRNYKLGFFEMQYNYQQLQDSLAVAYYEHGKTITDVGTSVIPVAVNSFLKLDDCVMERTTGGISGVIYDRATGDPFTSGSYLVVAFDEQGCPAKSSAYNPQQAPISGEYWLRGLWPGKYYLLALAFPQNGELPFAQWFNGIDGEADSVLNVPMPEVPPGAIPVHVSAGLTSGINFYVGLAVGIRGGSTSALPFAYGLRQNYPNPFNPSTTIRYELPMPQDVRLNVCDILGREVSVLVDERKDAGVHEVCFDGSGLAGGVYFYRLQAGSFVQARKILLLK